MNFWDFVWLLIWSFFFVMYLMVLFQIIGDLFRDPEVGGFAKAVWIIGLIVLPLVVALIYLIARGARHGRAAERRRTPGPSGDRLVRQVGGRHQPRRPDRVGDDTSRRRCHQPDRVRAAQGEGARLTAPPGL